MIRPARRLLKLYILAALAILVNACAPSATPLPAPTIFPFTLTSSAFTEGAAIPKKFSCDGENVSPQLKWNGAPANTRSFALIMDDPDAPIGTFTHWVAFDLPASQNEIAEGAKSAGKSGQNGAGRTGYVGPCPPTGSHRYFFTLYALDVDSLGIGAGVSRGDVEKAMIEHILAKAQLLGRYSR